MKKFKRTASVLLAALILLSALPLGSLAASVINSVELEINISDGMAIDSCKDYITVKTQGVEKTEVYDGNTAFVFDDNDYLLDGKFELGKAYNFCIVLRASEGYYFPGSEFELSSVTVNGEEAEHYLESSEDGPMDTIVVYYRIELGGDIKNVELKADVYGDMYVENYYEYIDFVSGGVDFLYNGEASVIAYDAEGNRVEEKFESGKEYTLNIFLEPIYNCSFAKDEDGAYALESVIVNGEAADYVVDSYVVNTRIEFIKIEVKVTAKTPKYINSINIELDTDLDGVSVNDWEDYITIKTEGLVFESYLGDPAVYVQDSMGNYCDTFAAGDKYYIYMYFSPVEGYFFPDDEVLESCTVNGEETENYFFSGYIAEDGAEIYFIGIEMPLDLVGDGFFAKLSFFFKNLFNWIQMLIFGFAI